MSLRYTTLFVATLSSVWKVNIAVETIDCTSSQPVKVGTTPTIYRYGDGETPYPITSSCTLVLEALDPNSKLLIGTIPKCGTSDVLFIYDGRDNSGTKLVDGCCTDCTKPSEISTGNALYVSFQSDGTSGPKELGFDLQVIAGTDQSSCSINNGEKKFTVDTSPTIISSPNFPSPYPVDRNCYYTFIPADASLEMKISFDTISLDFDNQCYDKIILRKDNVSGDIISTICEYGKSLTLFPNETQIVQGQLFLQFVSDSVESSTGFRAIVQQVTATQTSENSPSTIQATQASSTVTSTTTSLVTTTQTTENSPSTTQATQASSTATSTTASLEGTTKETTTENDLSTTQQDQTRSTTSTLTTEETSIHQTTTTEKTTSTEEQSLTTTLVEITSSTVQQSTTEGTLTQTTISPNTVDTTSLQNPSISTEELTSTTEAGSTSTKPTTEVGSTSTKPTTEAGSTSTEPEVGSTSTEPEIGSTSTEPTTETGSTSAQLPIITETSSQHPMATSTISVISDLEKLGFTPATFSGMTSALFVLLLAIVGAVIILIFTVRRKKKPRIKQNANKITNKNIVLNGKSTPVAYHSRNRSPLYRSYWGVGFDDN